MYTFLEKSFLYSLLSKSFSTDIAYNHHLNGKLTGFGFELIGHNLSKQIFKLGDQSLLNKEHVTLGIYSDNRYRCEPLFPSYLELQKLKGDLKFDVDTTEDISRINSLVEKLKITIDTDNIYKFLLRGN